jgi:hypothetical protein
MSRLQKLRLYRNVSGIICFVFLIVAWCKRNDPYPIGCIALILTVAVAGNFVVFLMKLWDERHLGSSLK